MSLVCAARGLARIFLRELAAVVIFVYQRIS